MILSLALAGSVLAPVSASADVAGQVAHNFNNWLGFAGEATEALPQVVPASRSLTVRDILPAPVTAVEAPQLAVAAPAAPSIETPLRRLFCVEYARMRSGLAVFGDAKHWWDRAKNLYARASHPVEEAVMVFAGSRRLRRGHVAVVTDIVSPREIIVDQANWQNRGEIDHATPVLDVSSGNDWSKVRVWNMASGQFGTHVYAISGFIAKDLVRQASND